MLAAGGDPGRLHVTLSSVRDQPSPAIEIVVVSYDGGTVAAHEAAADDTRARFFTAHGVAEARAVGLRRSAGTFALVATAGDAYPPGALADLLPALDPAETLFLSAGADDDGERADLRTRPTAARAPYLGRLVVARSRLRAGDAEDPDGMEIALDLLAAGFTATPFPAYRDARDTKPGPFAPRVDPLPGLPARVARDRATLDRLAGSEPAQDQRALGALDGLRDFLEAAEGADDATWSALVEHARSLRAEVPDQLDTLAVVPRVQALLTADDRRGDLVALVARLRQDPDFPTRVVDGRVIADLGVEVGEEHLVVGEEESRLEVQARRLLRVGDVLEIELRVGLRTVEQPTSPQVTAQLVTADRAVVVPVVASGPEVFRLRIPVAELAAGHGEIELDWADQGVRRTGVITEVAPYGSAARAAVPVADHLAARLLTRFGRVVLAVTAAVPDADDATVTRIEVTGSSLQLTTPRHVDAVRLEGNGREVVAVAGAPGFWTVPLVADSWGLGEVPLPTGAYRLHLSSAGAAVPAKPSPAVVDQLPAETRTPLHRVELRRGGAGGVVVRLDPLLTEDETGPRAQRRLQREFASATPRLDERLVYFQSFTGQWANDNPLAIQAELQRRRTDLDLRWVVADSSATPPPGTRPLLFRSREWYDVMTRASYLVTNIELEKWYRRREGQQVLQTFHGYPSKAMGLGLWEPRGYLPSAIATQLANTSGVWNNLVTPAPEMDQYYRRDYAYDGTILPLGYPRNDALVGAGAEVLREETRQRLGLRPDQRAILYAPTWRDDLATNFRAAAAVHHLDVARAAAALGDGYVLLLRGHRFHAPAEAVGSQVIDVTGYPDINHLIAASDAAVLDYSSLRFDFALTGRPMVFLVPDLEDYDTQVRGFLWDYRETTPGPLVASTAEVVTLLRDLDSLASRYAGEMVAFNARYNGLHDGRASERVVDAFFADLL